MIITQIMSGIKYADVGCHMGNRYCGALDYADNLTSLSPSRSGLSVFISDYERYAAEYNNNNYYYYNLYLKSNIQCT